MVGIQMFSVDLSDNTDAGFFAAGNDYFVVLYPDETVDTQNVSKVIAQFSIQNRFMRGTDSALLAANVTVSGGVVESNVKKVNDLTVTGNGVKGDAWRPA